MFKPLAQWSSFWSKSRAFWLRSLVVVCVLSVGAVLFSLAPVTASPFPVQQIRIDYARVKDSLRSTGVPLHLPPKVIYALPPDVHRTFYGTFGGASDDGYAVYIGHPDCPGAANSCLIAIASAALLTGETPSIEQDYPLIDPSTVSRVSPDPAGWVQLGKAQSAYFVPWVVGASMGFAQVIWDENGYRYTIGLKGGEKGWVVAMANSAVAP